MTDEVTIQILTWMTQKYSNLTGAWWNKLYLRFAHRWKASQSLSTWLLQSLRSTSKTFWVTITQFHGCLEQLCKYHPVRLYEKARGIEPGVCVYWRLWPCRGSDRWTQLDASFASVWLMLSVMSVLASAFVSWWKQVSQRYKACCYITQHFNHHPPDKLNNSFEVVHFFFFAECEIIALCFCFLHFVVNMFTHAFVSGLVCLRTQLKTFRPCGGAKQPTWRRYQPPQSHCCMWHLPANKARPLFILFLFFIKKKYQ